MSAHPKTTIIVGAGPAGLIAAYELAKAGRNPVVLEADPEYVGGISRTVRYRSYRFDIGGHRFFSRSREIEDLWTEILGPDMMQRPRASRIYYGGKFYSYPLQPVEALLKLGFLQSALCVLSYLAARWKPGTVPKSFEDWVVHQFGRRLFRIFFKTYTEKVWGMRCSEISADWAAQRIRGLSLGSAIKHALFPGARSGQQTPRAKTLTSTFRYPRLGPGMMWEECAKKVRAMGGHVLLGRSVDSCVWSASAGDWTITAKTATGDSETYTADHLISSMPLRQLVSQLAPRVPEEVRKSADVLRYRDFLTVGLILHERHRLADNWIYIHDPNVKMGRIQNYKAWSPEMVPDPHYCAYGLEYFCFEGDGLWTSSDAELLALAKEEIQRVGLADSANVVDGCVIRQPKAYPVYDTQYRRHVQTIREALRSRFPTLHLVGRNGMHRYNNQDHSMMTAILTARNILAGERVYDVWSVNDDCEYIEAVDRTGDGPEPCHRVQRSQPPNWTPTGMTTP